MPKSRSICHMRYLCSKSQTKQLKENETADFATHKEHSTYGDIGVGAFLAIRWGLGDNSVLVLKLGAGASSCG